MRTVSLDFTIRPPRRPPTLRLVSINPAIPPRTPNPPARAPKKETEP